jgi:hypothetical protein
MFRVLKYDNRLMLNEGTENFRLILRTLQIKSPVLFFLCFFESICCLTTQKKELPSKTWKKLQDRQTNLLFKFKDFPLFFAGALSQLILLDVFLTQYATKKKNSYQNLG